MKYSDNMSDTEKEQLLAECKMLDEAYADAMPAEQYNTDLLALVAAAQTVIGCSQEHRDMAIAALDAALQAFEPWLEQEETPQQMGWVDGKGRP